MTVLHAGSRLIGPGHPCYVIAEAGVNHNGDPALAHQLVDVAAACGADAVKFQAFDPEAVVAPGGESAAYQRAATGHDTQRALLDELALPSSIWVELAEHARERGIDFLCTPFDARSADVLADAGVWAYKVPSGEIDNLPFLRNLAARGRPLLISTGMADEDDVARAVEAVEAAPAIALLHCVSSYPAPPDAANLRVLPALAQRFRVPVGWSDHCVGHETAIAAVALGAALLERHITVNRSLPGPDHAASDDADGFADYVASVRTVASALGDGRKVVQPIEAANQRLVRRGIHAAVDLTPGTVLDEGLVVRLRPAEGLPPWVDITGFRVVRHVAAFAPVTWDDVEAPRSR